MLGSEFKRLTGCRRGQCDFARFLVGCSARCISLTTGVGAKAVAEVHGRGAYRLSSCLDLTSYRSCISGGHCLCHLMSCGKAVDAEHGAL